MEHISDNDVIQLSVSLYRNIGETMDRDSSKLLHLYRTFNIIVIIINLITIMTNLFYVGGGMYIKTIEGALTIIHALLKYIVFLYHKSDIADLLKDMLHFWSISDFTHAKTFNRNINRIYKLLRSGQNWYLAVSVFVVTGLFLRPVFSNENKYIFYCWVPDSIIIETIMLACQYYFMSILIYITFTCDSFYISYSIHVIVQLRLLNYTLKHLTTNSDVEQLYRCIRHHQLLLSIFQRMNRIYFWMFLFHYFVTLITGCTQLYVILLGNAEFIDLVTTTTYIVALLVQFGYWCFPVEEIVFQLSSISNAIYMSTWYQEEKVVKNILFIMMMRAQRQKYMSAGGLMEMNINTFGSVIRKIFSFYALLRNLLNK